MSDSEEIVLTFSVLSCQPEQFMSDSAEILIFTQSKCSVDLLSTENRPTFRRIHTGLLCRAKSNIFIRVGMIQVGLQPFGLMFSLLITS
jgi:hypothetical protein